MNERPFSLLTQCVTAVRKSASISMTTDENLSEILFSAETPYDAKKDDAQDQSLGSARR